MISPAPLLGESVKAYTAFQEYVKLGDQRSLKAVAGKLGKSETIIERWSSRWKWKKRLHAIQVTDYEQDLAATAEAKLERAREMEKRKAYVEDVEWESYKEMILIARQIMRRTQDKQKPSDAARLLQVASQMGRMSAEMPVTRAELTGKDGAPLAQTGAAIVQVNIERTEASDEVLKRFGKRPTERGG